MELRKEREWKCLSGMIRRIFSYLRNEISQTTQKTNPLECHVGIGYPTGSRPMDALTGMIGNG